MHTNYSISNIFFYFSDSCCSTVRLSTEGSANSSQNVRMGIYERVDTFSERPVYLHTDVDEYLFYMGGRTRGLWMVGPTIGTFRLVFSNMFSCSPDLKPSQNKKGQKIFQLHRFLITFSQLPEVFKIRCSWNFFRPFLF